MDKKTKQLRSESRSLTPRFIIGKNGLSDGAIKNIVEELKKTKLVKIRILPSFIEDKNKKEIAQEIILKTNSKLVDLVGFTLTITRK